MYPQIAKIMANLARQAFDYAAIAMAAAFTLLTTAGCEKQEQWLHCQEKRAWDDPGSQKTFYLNIDRSEEKTLGQYMDGLNTSPATIKENPITLTATTNIKKYPGQNGVVQVTYAINKGDLTFSKTTRNWMPNGFGKPENLGGITISKAGSCQLGKKPATKI